MFFQTLQISQKCSRSLLYKRGPRHQERSAQRAGAPERADVTGRSGGILSTVSRGSRNFGLDLYRVYCVALCKRHGFACLRQMAMDRAKRFTEDQDTAISNVVPTV